MGLVESRLLHPLLSDELRRQCAVSAVACVPVAGMPSATLLAGLTGSNDISDDQWSALESLAASIVERIGTVEARLRESELEVLRRLEAVDKLLPAFLRELDVRQLFDRVSALTRDVLRHDYASLGMYYDDLTQIQVYVQTTDGPFPRQRVAMPFPPAQTSALLYRIVNDLDAHPLDRPYYRENGGKTSIRVVLRREDTALGALNFTSRSPEPYTAADLRVASRIADYVALALSHQQLAEESRLAATLQEREANLTLLDGLLKTLTGVLDVRDVFDRISEVARRVLPHDLLGLPLFTDSGDSFLVHAVSGDDAISSSMRLPVTPQHRRLFEGTWDYQIHDDVQADPEMRDSTLAVAGYRSVLRVAIRLQQTFAGVLDFASRTPGHYQPADALIARRIADHIALALSHQRLAEESHRAATLQERATKLELLDDLLAAIGESGDLHETFTRISNVAGKVLPHDAVVLMVFHADRLHAQLYVGSGLTPGTLDRVVEIPESARDPEWEYDLLDDLRVNATPATLEAVKQGFFSGLRVPIRLEGQVVAGLGFLSKTVGFFSQDDVQVARRVADRVALSLARERSIQASKRADEATERASRLESRVKALTEELNARFGLHRVIGRSQTWRQALTQATQVASTETTVLLLGESGTGKEVVARFIHRASTRKNGPFVALNCAALPEQLLESELFGYERGAFTGAMNARAGKIEQAAGGVLFLDEVGEMSPTVQAKFLRVLQEREFQRLGGSKTLKADARVIAATNRDPKAAMERGQFREDLYYRLSVFEIALPPLRDRRDDILLLVETFLADLATNIGRPAGGLSEDAKDRLLSYHWPGNVRELRNAIERAVILAEGGLITSEHLPIAVGQTKPASSTIVVAAPAAGEGSPTLPSGLTLDALERDLLNKAMTQAKNNKSQAAKLLGVPRGQFYSLLKKHGLTDAKR